MGECGNTVIEDVTLSLFSTLQSVEVASLRALELYEKQVGVSLHLGSEEVFYFWIDGDELWWGDHAALTNHDWLDQRVPALAEYITF